MVPLVRKVMKQTRARILRGDTRGDGKLVSLFEPETEIIRKGRISVLLARLGKRGPARFAALEAPEPAGMAQKLRQYAVALLDRRAPRCWRRCAASHHASAAWPLLVAPAPGFPGVLLRLATLSGSWRDRHHHHGYAAFSKKMLERSATGIWL